MKYFSMLFLSLFILSACSSTSEVSTVNESYEGELPSAVTEKPEQGDIFMVDNDLSENVIYAYIEKDSEVTVNENEDTLEIHFDEPGESEDIAVQMIEFSQGSEIEKFKFYINGVETQLKSLIYE
ncbi:hypothetical protein [Jeotgalicoccus psychrophilus]|uniref:hypothetical protein n=1 Tax=Jeotgalicoccus psychrophilus TaxID=157228 RepID=UPI0004261C54|nr:hypothetical protein [Jeotgalicoccus psychrophilus]